MDGHLHPGHALVLPVELHLGHTAEFGQHRGQVVLQVDHVADAVTGAHQQGGGGLFLLLAVGRGQGGGGGWVVEGGHMTSSISTGQIC